MIRVVHKIASWVIKHRIDTINRLMRYPHEVQRQWFERLVEKGAETEWGRTYGIEVGMTMDQFRERVPISTYEELYPWIERSLQGEADLLWPGKRTWFAKSSGTTNDKSKYIPVTNETLDDCHFKAGQDMLAIYFHNRPDSQLFTGKALSVGGSHDRHPEFKNARVGDVSAVMTENLPSFYELVRTPSKEVALMPDWESKIEAMAKEVMHEDVTCVAGVPTWTMVLINHLFEKMNIKSRNLHEIWPNLEAYFHGGVSFEPYKPQFQSILPGPQMAYMDIYNASEGYFALQNESDRSDLLLLLDHGMFFEFLPMEELGKEHPQTHLLHEVEKERNYALIISNNSGLWRYMVGDTLIFTETDPFKIRVSGRTKQFINAFGEELMVENAEIAISEASQVTQAMVSNYTAGPIYLEGTSKGGHEWLIEFETAPQDLDRFIDTLDQKLQTLNSDYQAKRTGDIALGRPSIEVLPQGTFLHWMKQRGKLGGQHKVPRLANHRKYLESIKELRQES